MTKPSRPRVTRPQVGSAELEAVVCETLVAVPGANVKQLKAALPMSFRLPEKDVGAAVNALLARGEVHRIIDGKTGRFFARDPRLVLNEALGGRVSGAPLDEAQIVVLARDAAPGYERAVKSWISAEVVQGRLFVHAPSSGSRAKRYASEPDLTPIFKTVLTGLRKAMKTADAQGIARSRVAALLLAEVNGSDGARSDIEAQSEGTSDDRELVLGALRQMTADRPREALHSVREVRRRVTMEKTRFDRAALALTREGAISLHLHDLPASLPEEERAELVRDDRGHAYVGIAIRGGNS